MKVFSMKPSDKTGALPFVLAGLFLVFLFFLCNQMYLQRQVPANPSIPADTEILILGDSHASYALDPELIGKAYNFSGYSESYVHNYYKLKYALKQNLSLRAVILPIDLHSFSDFRQERVFFNPQWLPFIDYLEVGWIKNRFLPYLVKYLNLRLFAFRGKYSLLFKLFSKTGSASAANPEMVSGYSPQNKYILFRRDRQIQRAKNRAARQLRGFDPFSKEMAVFFKMILAECARNKLHVVLLKLPVSEVYYDEARRLIDIRQLYERMLALARPYRNVQFLDFQKLLFKNGAGFFSDSQHVNKTGAEKISRLVGKSLGGLRKR